MWSCWIPGDATLRYIATSGYIATLGLITTRLGHRRNLYVNLTRGFVTGGSARARRR